MTGEIEPLVAAMDRRVEATECDLHRSLFAQIDWDDRLVCIKGAKGTGKTTMMLQFLKEHPSELDRSIYVSLDNLWFANHSLLDVTDWLHNNGGSRLFVDEVHHRQNWQTLIKNVFDGYHDRLAQVVEQTLELLRELEAEVRVKSSSSRAEGLRSCCGNEPCRGGEGEKKTGVENSLAWWA